MTMAYPSGYATYPNSVTCNFENEQIMKLIIKKATIILSIIVISNTMLSQNIIASLQFKVLETTSVIHIRMTTGEIIELNSSYSNDEIRDISYYGTEKFAIVLIEPKYSDEYIINGAFKSKYGWVQDYTDRSYFKTNTGLTCTQITKIDIVDEKTLSVQYETTQSNNILTVINTKLVLGKYALYELDTEVISNFTLYGKGTKLSEQIKNSPRTNYSNVPDPEKEIPPPKPERRISAIKDEVDSLDALRKLKIEKLICDASYSCSIDKSDSLIIQINVNPNGKIIYHKMLSADLMSEEKTHCVVNLLNNTNNLGIIKVAPTARTGRKPQAILYTIPIKKRESCKD